MPFLSSRPARRARSRSAHATPRTRRHPARERGIVATMFVLSLVILWLMTVCTIAGHASEQDQSLRRLETVRAFYAAEAGTNMAIREIMLGLDEDADGAIGTVSHDGNDANDPVVGPARVTVDKTVAGGDATLWSLARCGVSRRKIQTDIDLGLD